MYVIGENTIAGIRASDQQDTYEASALETDSTLDKWKANSNTAVLTVGVAGGSAVLLANTNASTITISKADHITGAWGDSTAWGSINSGAWVSYAGTSLSVTTGQDAYGNYHAWATYTQDTKDHILTITMTAASGTSVEAGAVYVGNHLDINDFRMGLRQGVQSHSDVYPLGRRASYVDFQDQDVRRTWQGSVIMTISDWYDFRDACRERGARALAWMMSENIATGEWIALAKFTQFPTANFVAPSYVEVSFSLEES